MRPARLTVLPLLAATASLAATGLLVAACSKPSSDAAAAGSPSAAAVQSGTAAVASAAPAAAGPVVAIADPLLISGTACGDHPVVPSEELDGQAMVLTAFDIDAYPYPNDPAKAPLTGATRDEAAKLCAARGRRLCTEVEWEHACKGPKNTRYEYGDRFDAKVCPTGLGAIPEPGTFDKCQSAFGVHAMHGFAWEWTASDWKRGGLTDKVALRGGYGNAPYAHMRCTSAKAADGASKSNSVGFRCCGGAPNVAEISIPVEDPSFPALVEEKDVESDLLARLDRGLVNGKLRAPEGTTSSFTRVWQWHPAPREVVMLARYESKLASGATVVQPVVIMLCSNTVQLISRLRAPVDSMEEPEVKNDAPGSILFKVQAGTNSGVVKLTYQFGQVATDQPAWIQPGVATGVVASASAAPAIPSAAPSASAAPRASAAPAIPPAPPAAPSAAPSAK